jgi:hypothetical protein
MFDTITVETGLPDGASNQMAFQTKDFGAALREFRITPQGALEIRDKDWQPFAHHGLVTFHDMDRVYTAKFSRGLLIGIRSLRDPLIFYFWMPLNDLFDDIDHQMSAYRLLQPSESCRAPQP